MFYITYFISGDEFALSTSFKNGDVFFEWAKQNIKVYDVKINKVDWIRVYEPKYTVEDALIYDYINITVRVFYGKSHKDNNFTYNGELCMVFESLHFTWLFYALKFQ